MIKTTLQQTKPATLLDVGCGIGKFTQDIAKYCGQVTAIDASEDFLSRAIENHSAPNINYLKMNAEDLLFHDNSHEIVTIRGVLHHSLKWRTIINEAIRTSSNLILIEEPIDILDSREKQNTIDGLKLYLELQQEIGYQHHEHIARQELINYFNELNIEFSYSMIKSKNFESFNEFFANFYMFAKKSNRQAYWLDRLRQFKAAYQNEHFAENDCLFIRAIKSFNFSTQYTLSKSAW